MDLESEIVRKLLFREEQTMIYINSKNVLTERNSIVEITNEVLNEIKKSGIKNGYVLVETPDSTTGIISSKTKAKEFLVDLLYEIKNLVPSRITFKQQISPDETSGEIKNALFGHSVIAIIKDGKLMAGDSLGFYFLEYDGPTNRTYFIEVQGE